MKKINWFTVVYYGLIILVSSSIFIVMDNYYIEWSIEKSNVSEPEPIPKEYNVLQLYNCTLTFEGGSGKISVGFVDWLTETSVQLILIVDCERLIDYSINVEYITNEGSFLGILFYENTGQIDVRSWIELHFWFEGLT
ncbi:MAG: hypothetical protein ACTSYA_01855 [Candidatus Kariarchaeaceae archaeon]